MKAQSTYSLGSRSETLYRRLRDLAIQKGPEFKLPTTRELCDQFGASSVTVTHALNRLEKQNVIYRKPRSGIFVSPKLHQKRVRIFFNSGLISRAGLSPFWGVLSGLVLSEAQKRAVNDKCVYDFQLVSASHFHAPAAADELMRLCQEGQVHGILAIGVSPPLQETESAVPVVTYANPGQWEVAAPFDDAADIAVEALAGMGCRNVAVWTHFGGGEVDILHGQSFLRMLEPIYRRHQVPLRQELVKGPREFLASRSTLEDLSYQEQGYLVALKFFAQPGPKPDGIFLADDMFAEGVLNAFGEIGIDPRADVRIVSMCNAGSPILFGYEHLLTLLEYAPAEIVAALFTSLEALMARQVPEREMMTIRPKLIRPGEHTRRDQIKRDYGL